MGSITRIFTNRRMAALAVLGFASGLPLSLTSDTLQAWLTSEHVDIKKIGLFSLVGLPYTLKFLWAPVMDRFVPPFLGRRRGWLLITQLLLVGTIFAMGWTHPGRTPQIVGMLALAVAFLSASQDIVTDAYRTDVLPAEERGAGAALSTMGYRVAMMASGGGALILAGTRWHWSWAAIYALMALAMVPGMVATFFAPEQVDVVAAPHSLRQSVIAPFAEFLSRPAGWLTVLFVIIFKLPDLMTANMTTTFLLGLGLGQEKIGLVRQVIGMWVMIAGSVVGGGMVARLGLVRCLWVFGALHIVSNMGFCILAHVGPQVWVMAAVVLVESFIAGLVTAGFLAFLMSQCDHRFSATQYALLSGLMALTRVLSGACSGFLVANTGWMAFFAISAATGIPGMLMIPFLRTEDRTPKGSGERSTAMAGVGGNR